MIIRVKRSILPSILTKPIEMRRKKEMGKREFDESNLSSIDRQLWLICSVVFSRPSIEWAENHWDGGVDRKDERSIWKGTGESLWHREHRSILLGSLHNRSTLPLIVHKWQLWCWYHRRDWLQPTLHHEMSPSTKMPTGPLPMIERRNLCLGFHPHNHRAFWTILDWSVEYPDGKDRYQTSRHVCKENVRREFHFSAIVS